MVMYPKKTAPPIPPPQQQQLDEWARENTLAKRLVDACGENELLVRERESFAFENKTHYFSLPHKRTQSQTQAHTKQPLSHSNNNNNNNKKPKQNEYEW